MRMDRVSIRTMVRSSFELSRVGLELGFPDDLVVLCRVLDI